MLRIVRGLAPPTLPLVATPAWLGQSIEGAHAPYAPVGRYPQLGYKGSLDANAS